MKKSLTLNKNRLTQTVSNLKRIPFEGWGETQQRKRQKRASRSTPTPCLHVMLTKETVYVLFGEELSKSRVLFSWQGVCFACVLGLSVIWARKDSRGMFSFAASRLFNLKRQKVSTTHQWTYPTDQSTTSSLPRVRLNKMCIDWYVMVGGGGGKTIRGGMVAIRIIMVVQMSWWILACGRSINAR